MGPNPNPAPFFGLETKATSRLANVLRALGQVPEQVVRDHVHRELAVTEGVGGIVHSDQIHAPELGVMKPKEAGSRS